MRRSLLVLLGVTLAACGGSDDATPPPTVYAAYVLLAPAASRLGPIAVARAIVAQGQPACPTLTSASRSIGMQFRSNPHGFPVDVCEAVIPFDETFSLSWSGQALPAAHLEPSRLLVLGDTGCKKSDCSEGPAEPFADIAMQAATINPVPDLILHVGDYNYRGTPGSVKVKGADTKLSVYDAGDDAPEDPECQLTSDYVSQNAPYSEEPDTWETWWVDFFQPAAPLLARAPWVFVRGNHELCSRAGPGWFYFLDAGVLDELGGTGQLSCPDQGGDTPPQPPILKYLQFAPPYVLDLGTLQLAVVDSANACDAFAPNRTTDIYTAQLLEVLDGLRPDVPTWVASHRPFSAANKEVATSDITPPLYTSINRTLQEALAMAVADGPGILPDQVRLFVAGHMHAFQSLTFYDQAGAAAPPQLVVGNSGVALDEHAPSGAFDVTIDDYTAHLAGLEKFGLLSVEDLDPAGSWSGVLLGKSGEQLAACDSDNLPASLCVLSSP